MTKLRLHVYDIEVEYEGDEKFLETKVMPFLETLKKLHNERLKWDLLEMYEGLQENLIALEGYSASMIELNDDLARTIENFSEKSNRFLESIRTDADMKQEFIEATKEMQEMNMSFNLQYLQFQNQMQSENRQFTVVSNIMKTKHDTAKNSINNIR